MSVVFENDAAEEVAQSAGWSGLKGRRLLERFVHERGLDDEFVEFLEHRLDVERGEVEEDDDDEYSGGDAGELSDD